MKSINLFNYTLLGLLQFIARVCNTYLGEYKKKVR